QERVRHALVAVSEHLAFAEEKGGADGHEVGVDFDRAHVTDTGTVNGRIRMVQHEDPLAPFDQEWGADELVLLQALVAEHRAVDESPCRAVAGPRAVESEPLKGVPSPFDVLIEKEYHEIAGGPCFEGRLEDSRVGGAIHSVLGSLNRFAPVL